MQEKKISQKIINYSIWYYCKFFPSIQKLKQKLEGKFGPNSEKGKKYGGISEEDIQYILSQKLKNILCEEEIIDAKIRNLRFKGKSKQYILSKLYEKGFQKEMYQEIILKYYENGEHEILEKEICKTFKTLDLSEASDNIQQMDFAQKNKMTQKIIRKGFAYQDVKDLLNM